ncbi:unnamed protein product [Arctogadus glacialis]
MHNKAHTYRHTHAQSHTHTHTLPPPPPLSPPSPSLSLSLSLSLSSMQVKVKKKNNEMAAPLLCGRLGRLTFGHLSIISFNSPAAGKMESGVSNSVYCHGNNRTEVRSPLGAEAQKTCVCTCARLCVCMLCRACVCKCVYVCVYLCPYPRECVHCSLTTMGKYSSFHFKPSTSHLDACGLGPTSLHTHA